MTPWGSHIRRHLTALTPALIAGCSAAPPPEPTPPPPPPPATSAPTPPPPPPPEFKPDPPGASAGLSTFQQLRSAPSTGQIGLRGEDFIPFGKGVLAHGNLTSPKNSSECLVAGKTRAQCNFYRIAPWSRAPQGMGYLGPVPESSLGAWSALTQAPGYWSSFSPGGKVVYAVRNTSGLTIDTIDEKGEIATPFTQATLAVELANTQVAELPQGLAVAGVENNDSELQIIPLLRGSDGKLTAKDPVKTGVTILPEGATAAWARNMASPRRKIGYGQWTVVPALDAKGEPEGAFYLAWTEVIPPAKYSPAGVAPKKKGAKNGCGRGSRPLSDISVEKKVHVSRFSAEGKRLDDKIASSVTFGEDDGLKLTLIPTSYGYVLNNVAHGRDGLAKRDAPVAPRVEGLTASPSIPIPPLQTIEASAFDQKRGEGIAIIGQENHQIISRFDGTGEPLGEPVTLEERVSAGLNRNALALAGDAWASIETGANFVRILSGANAGKNVAIPSDQGWRLPHGASWILPLDDDSVEVVRYLNLPRSALESLGITDRETALAPVVSRVNLKRAEATPWKLLGSWFDSEKKPRLQHVSWVGRGADGQILFFGWGDNDKQAQLHRVALDRDEWAKPAPLGEGAPGHRAVFLSVWKDSVALFDDTSSAVSWINKGLTIQLGRGFRQMSTVRNNGPLLRPGDLALSGEVGEPVKVDAETKKVFNSCPASFATGPRRLLLLCVEPPDAKTPGARVGTRVVRF